MNFKAKLSNLRISPRKTRLVADLIRGKKVDEAQSILKFTVKGASNPILKLLNSAEANAKNKEGIDGTKLFISRIIVNEGPDYKRMMPRARGKGDIIRKKTSHIELEVRKIETDKKTKTNKKNES